MLEGFDFINSKKNSQCPPRLHLETTLPSYLVARPSRNFILAGQQEARREEWEEKRLICWRLKP